MKLNLNLFKNKTETKMAELAKTLPKSAQVKQTTITKLNNRQFEETRIFKKGTVVTRTYNTNETFDKLELVNKIVLPAKNKGKSTYEGGIRFETVYTKAQKFFAALRSNCLNCDFTTYTKDKNTDKMISTKGLGAFNRAMDALGRM